MPEALNQLEAYLRKVSASFGPLSDAQWRHLAEHGARTRPDGRLVPLTEQDRSLWDTRLIAEGVDVLQTALTRDRLGEFQAQASIAALHADAHTAEETDWVQIVGWYDELVRLTDNPVARLNRAVAVGEADGPTVGAADD